MRSSIAVLLVVAMTACGDDGPSSPPPLFPTNYAATYQEVRSCRLSIEHDSFYMRVLAAPDALGPYTTRTAPFPVGSILLKEHYDDNDRDCSGPVIGVTAMKKLEPGTAAETIGWEWEETDDKLVPDPDIEVNRCVRCHTDCGVAPDGYDGTCTVP